MRSTPTQINSTARTSYNIFRPKTTLFIWLGFVLVIAVLTRTKSADTAMGPKSVLIVGANRGIGLYLTKLFAREGYKVFGSIRPQSKDDISVKDLEDTGANILEIDYLDERTIVKAAQIYGDQQLDVLVNVGGLPTPPKAWEDHTYNRTLEQFKVMALGPFVASKHFLPNLKKSPLAKIINISSNLASQQDNDGRYLGYRMAKAALNSQTRTLAAELKLAGFNIAVVAINPGHVATRLTNFKCKVDIDVALPSLFKVIEKITMENTGEFVNWDGTKINL